MKRIIRIACVIALVLAAAGCGKKKTKQQKQPVEPTPTEQVTQAPTQEPDTVKQGVASFPVSCSAGWVCQGMLSIETKDNLPGAFGNGATLIKGLLTEYRIENSANTELLRITSNVTEQGIVYMLKIGKYERRLKSITDGDNTLELFRYEDRYVIRQNGTDLLMVSADAEAMTISANEEEGAWAFRFPVKQNIVSETDASGSLYLGEDTITPKVSGLKDIYDGAYLSVIEDRIRAGAGVKERTADYVQITKKRVTQDGQWTEYNALYQSNTVIVDRADSSAPSRVTEYEFRELSNGISEVAYFTSTTGDEKPDYTFSVEALDEFRTAAFAEEETEERSDKEFRKGRIPFLIIQSSFGFIERGYRKNGEEREDYIRLSFCDGTVAGDVYAVYRDGEAASVYVDALSGADGRIYADGEILREDRTVRNLREYTYDEYGVMVKETRPGYTAAYEYSFSDFAYGGADDTIRHEWQKLMPYLEKAPKETAQGE